MYIGVEQCIGSIYGCYVWVGGCEVITGEAELCFLRDLWFRALLLQTASGCCDLDFGLLCSWLCCGLYGGIEFV